MISLIKRLAFDAAEPIERLSAQFLKKGADEAIALDALQELRRRTGGRSG
jgi:hypothetical protein